MTWMPPEDQLQREQAIAPAQSVHVEAPAGSGKTTVLMKRYLALLAQVREPEEILALTFTRKAAGELRTRIQAELNKREEPGEADELPPHEAELRDLALAALRRHADKGIALLERLQINTFHGFCAQLLRLAPHRAGLPPDFGLLEELEAKRLHKESVALLGQQLRTRPPEDAVRQALVRRLVRLNNNWPRLAAELQDLVARRDILGKFIVLARESRDPAAYEKILKDHLSALLQPRLEQLVQEFRQAEVGRRWPELSRCLAAAGSSLSETLPAALPGATLGDLPGWRAVAEGILTGKGGCYQRFSGPKFPKGFRESACCGLLRDLPESLVAGLKFFQEMSPLLLPADEVAAVQDLIILLSQALTSFEALCAARRSLDFTALEQIALQVLTAEDLPELFLRLDRRLTHLLVDEFQDTSVNQMHLLCRLLAGWQGDRRRSLMVVGDPKQSIYGWRQARLELFFRSREARRLPDCPEAPTFATLALKTNFRASAALIDWTNAIFGDTIMADREAGGVDFKAAVPKPGAPAGSPPHLALFTGPEARALEADWLARELLRLCHRQSQLPPEERETVGVLLFTRTHLAKYLEAWRRLGLSPRVRDGLPLAESLAVQHLHNLAAALARPHDDVAWAALLRGWAGPQPLALLAAVSREPGDFWSGKLRRYAARPDCQPAVARLAQALAAARQQVGREPLDAILAACLIELEGWETLAAWEGPQGVANGRAYLELLARVAAATPEATVGQAAEVLAQSYQPPDPQAQDSPLEVLTVHGAKGLEFDHVFLPFLDWRPGRAGKQEQPFLMEEVPGTGTAIIALNRSYLQEQQSVLYQTLAKTAQKNALAEARRLFYVAVTRARRTLKMSGVVKANKAGDWQFPNNAPLGWLGEHYSEAELDPGALNLWPQPRLTVTLAGEVADRAALPATPSEALGDSYPDSDLPEPYECPPEPWPYEIQFPSRLAVAPAEDWADNLAAPNLTSSPSPEAGAAPENSSMPAADLPGHFPPPPGGEGQGEGGVIEPDPVSRLRGEISHRLLETLSRSGALPAPAAVAPALQTAAGSPTAALSLAEEILKEIRACQADPFLAPLLAPNLPVARSEWLLEAWHTDGILYRGQIDRLVHDGSQWWLLDYKTSRPEAGLDWELFIARETEKYRPQLLAYRDMAARFHNIRPPAVINTVLYFTACQRHVLI